MMRRREFLAASGLTAATIIVQPARAADEAKQQGVFELRMYHFASADKMHVFEDFLPDAINAWNRAGAEPVGAFKMLAKENPDLKLSDDSNDL